MKRRRRSRERRRRDGVCLLTHGRHGSSSRCMNSCCRCHGSESVSPAVTLTFLQVEMLSEVDLHLLQQLHVQQQEADVSLQHHLGAHTHHCQKHQANKLTVLTARGAK